MMAGLSALHTGYTLFPRNIISLFMLSESQGLAGPEGLGELRKFTSSGLETVTFPLVA
jgi:hypothetical protein